MQDGVFDITEDEANVLCVDGGGEVMVKGLLLLFSTLVTEALDQELLHVLQIVGLPCELGEVVLDVHVLNFIFQQVCLIEEENDGDVGEDAVVDDSLEDIERLREPVGLTVFHEHLIVLAG